jgi:hypothetical protein
MRLHIDDRNGLDALKAELTQYAVILLDGVKQTGVIEADEENGFIVRMIREDDPRWKNEFAFSQHWPTERLSGHVRIKDSRDEYK